MKILTNTRVVMSGLAVAGIVTAGVALGAAPAQAASTSVWDRVAACESGGDWSIDTGNGYYGGLQFTLSTWHAYGGSGNPADASKATQIAIAEKVLAGQGWGAWPVCSVKAGATGSSSSVSSGSSGSTRSVQSSSTADAPVTSNVPAAPSRPAAVTTSGRTYTVEAGDSLSTISSHLHITAGWQRLWAANPKIADPDLIHPGQRLQLPA